MCSLFGIIDYSNALPSVGRKTIVKILSEECEIRGTDATGYAYNTLGRLRIFKRPVRGSRIRFRVPFDSKIIMGHTRMTTKGNEKNNYNNHPFFGRAGSTNFALAHNGVLHNDELLRKTIPLPKTKIETDSFVAVQLLQRYNAITIESLAEMAETVSGTFCFSILTENKELYLVKGNNPLSLYDCGGYYIYASTEEILKRTFERLCIKNAAPVALDPGTIVKISSCGEIMSKKFSLPNSNSSYWYSYPYYSEISDDYFSSSNEIDTLIEYAGYFGIDEEDIMLLINAGFSDFEIEEMINDPYELRKPVKEIAQLV